MSRRETERCALCLMHVTLCICELVPQLTTRTRLSLLVHYREARKPTNTGQLAARCLVRSGVQVVGLRNDPITNLELEAGTQPLLLFPAKDALPLTEFANSALPIQLFVPDGTWRQASKMRQRVPGLASLTCVTLPEGDPSSYRLRSEPREGGLATFEAIVRALAILEGAQSAQLEQTMLTLFNVMVERTCWLRGTLRDDQVSGGVPPAAQAHNPRGGSPRATS